MQMRARGIYLTEREMRQYYIIQRIYTPQEFPFSQIESPMKVKRSDKIYGELYSRWYTVPT